MTAASGITTKAIAFNSVGSTINWRGVYDSSNNAIFTNQRSGAQQQAAIIVTTTDEITYTPTTLCTMNTNDLVRIRPVAGNVNGGVYVFGLFSSSTRSLYNSNIAIGSGGDTPFVMDLKGGNDVYVARYNNSGVPEWYVQVATTLGDFCNFGVIGADDKIYIVGHHNVNVSIYAPLYAYDKNRTQSPLIEDVLNEGTNAFAVVFTSDGFFDSYMRLRSPLADIGYGIAVDDINNAIYITGNFNYSASAALNITDFNGNEINLMSTLAFTDGADGFILKLNKKTFTVNTQWIRQVSGAVGITELGQSLVIHTDSTNDVMCSFSGRTSMKVYTTSGTIFRSVVPLNTGNTNYLITLVRYSSSGTPLWVVGIDCGTSSSVVSRIATTSDGSTYLLMNNNTQSYILNTQNASGSYGSVTSLTFGGVVYACLIKFTNTGIVEWTRFINATSGQSVENIQTINNKIYVTIRYGSGPVSCLGVTGVGVTGKAGTALLTVTSSGTFSVVAWSGVI